MRLQVIRDRQRSQNSGLLFRISANRTYAALSEKNRPLQQAVPKLRLRPPFSVARPSPMLTHMLEYAALVASPRALPDGLILVFQHPVSCVYYQSPFKDIEGGFKGDFQKIFFRIKRFFTGFPKHNSGKNGPEIRRREPPDACR